MTSIETYYEQTVTAPPSIMRKVLYLFCWLSIIVLGLIFLVSFSSIMGSSEDGSFSFNYYALISAVVTGGGAFLIWRGKDKLDTEYDYNLTGSVFQVDAIYAQKRRKRICQLDMTEVTNFGPAKGNTYSAESRKQGVKTKRYYLGNTDDLYYIAYHKGDVKHLLLLEMNEEMREGFELTARKTRPGFNGIEGKVYY